LHRPITYTYMFITYIIFLISVYGLADKSDDLGVYTDDSPSTGGTTHKQRSDPSPGDHLAPDDLFLLKASFLSKNTIIADEMNYSEQTLTLDN